MRISVGESQIDLTLETGAADPPTVGDALTALVRRSPGIEPHLPSCRVAVGVDYAPLGQPLRDGDEISLIPPVQGG